MDIMGATAIPFGGIEIQEQWEIVRKDRLDKNRDLQQFIARVRRMEPLKALTAVNDYVNNNLTYRADTDNAWVTANTTIRGGSGDCEDFAILKMQILHDVGFAEQSLGIVVVKDSQRAAHHAVLVVNVENTWHILDIVDRQVLPSTYTTNYQPLFGFFGEQGFLFGKRQ